jgi:tRNA-specific 2-thiouridylase
MNSMSVQGKRIFVGLSGGVDSALSAALLKEQGALVTGVFIKGWYPPGMPCTWAADRRDAMRVAAHLQIPFRTLDASAAYKKGVIDYMVGEYRAGRTPNPDVMCNREVKFGVFYHYAKEAGADLIATGHYLSGEKDQRYFLWAVPKEVLAHAVFPVGHMKKEEVRRRAIAYGLPVAAKKDSQGVCFLGDVSVHDFLESEFGSAPGDAVDEAGTVIGTHSGVLLHTIGERIALMSQTKRGPWFVRAKDVERNVLIVGTSAAPKDQKAEVSFDQAQWHQDSANAACAQYRYRGPRVEGQVQGTIFLPHEPLPEIPVPGQSIVFFDTQGELVGGAIIQA